VLYYKIYFKYFANQFFVEKYMYIKKRWNNHCNIEK